MCASWPSNLASLSLLSEQCIIIGKWKHVITKLLKFGLDAFETNPQSKVKDSSRSEFRSNLHSNLALEPFMHKSLMFATNSDIFRALWTSLINQGLGLSSSDLPWNIRCWKSQASADLLVPCHCSLAAFQEHYPAYKSHSFAVGTQFSHSEHCFLVVAWPIVRSRKLLANGPQQKLHTFRGSLRAVNELLTHLELMWRPSAHLCCPRLFANFCASERSFPFAKIRGHCLLSTPMLLENNS